MRGSALINEVFAGQAADTLSANDLRKVDNQTLLNAVDESGWANQSRIVIDGWCYLSRPHKPLTLGVKLKCPCYWALQLTRAFAVPPQ